MQGSVVFVERIIDSFSNSFTNARYALQIQKTSRFDGANRAKMAEKRLFRLEPMPGTPSSAERPTRFAALCPVGGDDEAMGLVAQPLCRK